MKNNLIIFCSLIVTIFSALSCTDDNKTVNTTEFTLNTTLPEGLRGFDYFRTSCYLSPVRYSRW